MMNRTLLERIAGATGAIKNAAARNCAARRREAADAKRELNALRAALICETPPSDPHGADLAAHAAWVAASHARIDATRRRMAAMEARVATAEARLAEANGRDQAVGRAIAISDFTARRAVQLRDERAVETHAALARRRDN